MARLFARRRLRDAVTTRSGRTSSNCPSTSSRTSSDADRTRRGSSPCTPEGCTTSSNPGQNPTCTCPCSSRSFSPCSRCCRRGGRSLRWPGKTSSNRRSTSTRISSGASCSHRVSSPCTSEGYTTSSSPARNPTCKRPCNLPSSSPCRRSCRKPDRRPPRNCSQRPSMATKPAWHKHRPRWHVVGPRLAAQEAKEHVPPVSVTGKHLPRQAQPPVLHRQLPPLHFVLPRDELQLKAVQVPPVSAKHWPALGKQAPAWAQ
mmetsp:Transcript_69517/g.213109  ORF Transcript_69517/g.213109 Transcript_69517/m.213109 type:complete len:259 (+) Transcript_69517:42-818(+)